MRGVSKKLKYAEFKNHKMLAYQELGENEVERKSLTYYAEFVGKTYLEIPGLVVRLFQRGKYKTV